MDEKRRTEDVDDVIDLGGYFAIFRKVWWKVGLLSLAVGVATLLVTLRMPNIYRASATITPSVEESKQNPALGAIASLGFQVGGPSKVEDLEILFKSNDLTARVFSKHNLWPFLLQDRYDAKTGLATPSWSERLVGKTTAKPPGEWDAIRAVQKRLTVSVNRRAGSISLSFESPSPQGSADIVKNILDEAKSRLQEEALERANKNKKFIEEQIGRTVDVLNRERLYSLLGQEIEKEMMARNREQFGFRVIDSPRVPDRFAKPQRTKIATTAAMLSLIASWIIFVRRARKGAQLRADADRCED